MAEQANVSLEVARTALAATKTKFGHHVEPEVVVHTAREIDQVRRSIDPRLQKQCFLMMTQDLHGDVIVELWKMFLTPSPFCDHVMVGDLSTALRMRVVCRSLRETIKEYFHEFGISVINAPCKCVQSIPEVARRWVTILLHAYAGPEADPAITTILYKLVKGDSGAVLRTAAWDALQGSHTCRAHPRCRGVLANFTEGPQIGGGGRALA